VPAPDDARPWSEIAAGFEPVAALLDDAIALVRTELEDLPIQAMDSSWRSVCDREAWSSYSYWVTLSVTYSEGTRDGAVERASVLVTYVERQLHSQPAGAVRLQWGAERFHLGSSTSLFKEGGELEWDPGARPSSREVATAIVGLLRAAREKLGAR
jgi:hypothetical protein